MKLFLFRISEKTTVKIITQIPAHIKSALQNIWWFLFLSLKKAYMIDVYKPIIRIEQSKMKQRYTL